MNKTLIFGFSLWIVSSAAWSHGPTPQKLDERIEIKAPVDKVWELLRKFEKASEWHGGIKQSLGDGKQGEPRVRTLVLPNDEQLVEEMDFFSDQDHEYGYRLKQENIKALPVSSYSVKFQAIPGASSNSTVVTVKSRFYRGDTGNTPPESLNDAAAVKAMSDFFKTGLDSLRQKLEQ